MDPVVEAVDILFRVKFVLVSSKRFSDEFYSKFKCSITDVVQLFPEIRGIQDCIRDPSSNTAFQVNRVKLSVFDNNTIDNRIDLKSHLLKVVTSEVDPKRLISEDIDDLSTPWFESWKRQFLKSFHDMTIGHPSHEFIGCYFGSIYVLSVDELINFKDVLVELQSKVSSNIKWFFSNFIKYFIVIGNKDNPATNHPQFNELVQIYGVNSCFSLDILDSGIKVSVNNDHKADGQANSVFVNPTTELSTKLNEVTLDPLSLGQQVSQTNDVVEPVIQIKSGRVEEKNILIDSLTSQTIETCLRKLVVDILIPWSEKQMKLLEDIIKRRKNQGSIFNLSKGLSTLASLRSNSGRADAIYNLTSDEMVARKCGDLCLSLGLLELSFKYYNESRRDFQGDGAHLFTAGACEMVGIVSHLLLPKGGHEGSSKSKNSLTYLDQSIGLYLDTCKVDHLATRATILASLVMASMETGIGSNTGHKVDHKSSDNHRSAASMFIRMTSEENDLHSGLFLEQAAKSFKLNGKNRKSSFHFVLCGHRYNKCGLTSLALISYRRYICKDWFYSVEHVQYTLSKLYLKSKYNLDSDMINQLKIRGIDTLRKNCDKELFFQDFKFEAEKNGHLMLTDVQGDVPYFVLDIPFIMFVKKDEIEGSFTSKDGRSSCFINEPFTVSVTLWTPFPVEASCVTLIPRSGQQGINVTSHDLTFTSDEMIVKFNITSQVEGNFDILGLQYFVGNKIMCRKLLSEKLSSKLKFNCIKSLPPLDLVLSRAETSEPLYDVHTIESLSGEVVPINAIIQNSGNNGWSPTGIKLTTSTGITMAVQLNQPVSLDIESPFEPGSHLIEVKIEYFEGTKSRTVTRFIELFVREVLLIENLIHGVISLRNILTTGQSLTVMDCNISPGLTAHLLINDLVSIDWTLGPRRGQLKIQCDVQEPF